MRLFFLVSIGILITLHILLHAINELEWKDKQDFLDTCKANHEFTEKQIF